jgi:hypothetical protein
MAITRYLKTLKGMIITDAVYYYFIQTGEV